MTNQHISNQDHPDNSLLDLSDIWRAIVNSWKLITSVTLLFALIGLGLASILPNEWEAKATLRIGHILSNAGDDSKLIEDPLQTVERIKLLGFKQKILANLDLPLELGINKRSDLFISSLKANSISNTDFINLSVHGYNAIDAADNINTTVKEIRKIHLMMEQSLRDKLQSELKANTENLAAASIELANLKNKIATVNAHRSSSDFAPSIVIINMLASKEADVRSLKDQQIQYLSRLSILDEQATSLVDTIHVSKRPIFPNRNIFLAVATLFGFLLGTGVSIWKYKKN